MFYAVLRFLPPEAEIFFGLFALVLAFLQPKHAFLSTFRSNNPQNFSPPAKINYKNPPLVADLGGTRGGILIMGGILNIVSPDRS